MAMLFNGSSTRVNISSWTNLTTVSVSLWFYLNSPLKYPERIFGSGDNWEIRCTDDWTPGVLKCTNELWSSTVTQPPCTGETVVANTWYHIVATSVKTGNGYIYMNGNLDGSGSCQDNETANTLSIGGRNTAPLDAGINGIVDDVRVYNRILSLAEVEVLYHSKGCDNLFDGLTNRWLLNEGGHGDTVSGASSVKDVIGMQHGTPEGSPLYNQSFLKWRRMTIWQ